MSGWVAWWRSAQESSRWLSRDAVGGLALVVGTLRAAGYTALVPNGLPNLMHEWRASPAAWVPCPHCWRWCQPVALTLGGWSSVATQPACRAGWSAWALRTVVPQSLIDGGRNTGAGWAGRRQEKEKWWEEAGNAQKCGLEVGPAEAGPRIISTACSQPGQPGDPWGWGMRLALVEEKWETLRRPYHKSSRNIQTWEIN